MAVSKWALYGGLVIVGAGAWWWSGEPEAEAKPLKKKLVAKKTPKLEVEFTEEDYNAEFDKPKIKLKNIFVPLVATAPIEGEIAPLKLENVDIIKIPADLAEGDPNWTYTGYASINGSKMALLENASKKQASYVHEGESWKKTKVRYITSANIVLVDKEGKEIIVLRHQSNSVAKPNSPSTPGGAPSPTPNMPPPNMRGPIGVPPNMMPSFSGGPVIIQE